MFIDLPSQKLYDTFKQANYLYFSPNSQYFHSFLQLEMSGNLFCLLGLLKHTNILPKQAELAGASYGQTAS